MLVVSQWWAYIAHQFNKPGRSLRLATANAAAWVAVRQEVSESGSDLTVESIKRLMEGTKQYIEHRKNHSTTGKGPTDVEFNRDDLDANQAKVWRISEEGMVELVKIAKKVMQYVGGTKKARPVTVGSTTAAPPTDGAHLASVSFARPFSSSTRRRSAQGDSAASAAVSSPALNAFSPALVPGGANERSRRASRADEAGAVALRFGDPVAKVLQQGLELAQSIREAQATAAEVVAARQHELELRRIRLDEQRAADQAQAEKLRETNRTLAMLIKLRGRQPAPAGG
ncbi:hypothetical protein BU14_0275s0026 [Porphyra umbilicalis]|uniref:Uncharacterized protein n=1 Tax=Porphyra umbilicalis TaxID=2786 RepID=A0A1X6P1G3_PORUM|nr:hypothetical protein BU14_0275s0026 [Porphyra umbilicalis]|eukprot:OSX74667.1 hypothetical protein BU14_0275s0026 [Porphyra umbilicalis]